MENPILINYIRENYGKYKLEDIKSKILKGGYPEQDFNDALNKLGLNKELNSTPSLYPKTDKIKWMKIGGFCGFIPLIFTIFLMVLSFLGVSQVFISPIFRISVMIMLLISFISILMFYFGFYNLGKFAHSKLIKFSSLVRIITLILFVLLTVLAIIFLWGSVLSSITTGTSVIGDRSFSEDDPLNPNGLGSIYNSQMSIGFVIVLLLVILLGLFFLIVQILFSVGLIKVRDRVQFSRLAGILGLILGIINLLLFTVSIFLMIKIFTNPLFLFEILAYSAEYNNFLTIFWIGLTILGLLTFLSEAIVLLYGSKKFE